MRNPDRKIAFVLVSSEHGTLILNRLDYHMLSQASGYGVGFEILERGTFQVEEINSMIALLELRRKHFGDGVVAIDCGANVGTHTVEWAKKMTGWGRVIAIEAQERIFYALAGNIAINNCLNAQALHAAAAEKDGSMIIPAPNYLLPASFGSLELKKRENSEFIGQSIEYGGSNVATVRTVSLDSLNLPRVDLIKIDVEGMEIEVLQGAAKSIEKSKPILLVEAIKVNPSQLSSLLGGFGYQVYKMGQNFLGIHSTDKAAASITARV